MIIVFEKKKLKNYIDKDNWNAIHKSIKDNLARINVGLGASINFFSLNNGNFVQGEGEVADKLAEYCNYSWDKEDSTIENYPEVMKDLCT